MTLKDELSSSLTTKDDVRSKNFWFPYERPYSIQLDFMNHLNGTLNKENGPRISIMQSPTGTGKTLSVICGTLSWLRDMKQRKERGELDARWLDESRGGDGLCLVCSARTSGLSSEAKDSRLRCCCNRKRPYSDAIASESDDDDDEPDWVKEQTSKKRKEISKDNASKRRRLEGMTTLISDSLTTRQQPMRGSSVSGDNDEDLLLEESDEFPTQLIKDLYEDELEELGREEENLFELPKVIFCTRTHSQVAQFIREFMKTDFRRDISVVPLGSRSNLCIHPKVKRLQSMQLQSDRCQSLRQQKKCDFYDQTSITLFKETALKHPCDIEDLGKIGRRVQACPYYGSRKAMQSADLIVMPYASFVNEQVRKSLGIRNLKGCVVIFDEGHNLEDALQSSHASPLNMRQLTATRLQLNRYLEKYKLRLKRSSLNKIQRIINVIGNFLEYLKAAKETTVARINDFMCATRTEDVNMWEIHDFITTSKLAQKLNGFIDRYRDETVNNGDEIMQNCIHPTLAFLLSLTNVGSNGRLVIDKDEKGNNSIRFLLLNPSVYFESICKEAYSVILAGGTMEPIQRVTQQLFPRAFRDSVKIFECGHVIPDTHLLPVSLSHYFHNTRTNTNSNTRTDSTGPKDTSVSMRRSFNFTMQNRNNPQMIDAVGEAMLSFCEVVPGGVICFFPSYAYEETVLQQWMKSGLLQKIQNIKHVYREPKKATDVDQVLLRYKGNIDKPEGMRTGAFLSSVIGGKMSEGINFADNYGRLVCVVGLPYPNQMDPFLQEKMKFLDMAYGPKSGQKYYRDLCMNAVNQSIGRSIRHAQDYAAIVLIDERYSDLSIQNELPKWIKDKKIRNCDNIASVKTHLEQFFTSKDTLTESPKI